MSLTASAPPAIEEQLLESPSMHSPTFVKHTLDCPNIFHSALKKTSMTVSGIGRFTELLIYDDSIVGVVKFLPPGLASGPLRILNEHF